MPKKNKPSNKQSEQFESNLESLRKEIDQLDKKVVECINQRAHYVKKVGELKEESQERTYRPERENKIIKSLEQHLRALPEVAGAKSGVKVDFPIDGIKSVFTEIISACRSLENPLSIGYLGPEGSFTHLASKYQFGHLAQVTPLKNFETIFQKFNKKEIDYGVIPLENSTDGMINQSIDLFTKYEAFICAELFLTINLNLYSTNKKLSQVKKVYSHPQPFAQSKNWLYENLPNAHHLHMTSTSESASRILKEKASACIASKQIGKIYPRLHCLAENIQDFSNNTTRFVVITSKKMLGSTPEPSNITSLMIFIKDKPGALYEILAILARAKVNLTNLVSRPSKKRAFDYLFYLDFIGHPKEKRVQKVLSSIEKYVIRCEILGTYPRGMKYSS